MKNAFAVDALQCRALQELTTRSAAVVLKYLTVLLEISGLQSAMRATVSAYYRRPTHYRVPADILRSGLGCPGRNGRHRLVVNDC